MNSNYSLNNNAWLGSFSETKTEENIVEAAASVQQNKPVSSIKPEGSSSKQSAFCEII